MTARVELLDLSEGTAGLYCDGSSDFVTSIPGPPRRVPGLVIGAPSLTRNAPHGGEMHPDGDELLYLLSGAISASSTRQRIATKKCSKTRMSSEWIGSRIPMWDSLSTSTSAPTWPSRVTRDLPCTGRAPRGSRAGRPVRADALELPGRREAHADPLPAAPPERSRQPHSPWTRGVAGG